MSRAFVVGLLINAVISEGITLDIYVCVVSSAHNVTAKGFYIAIVSTAVESSNPEAELKPGLDLLGEIREKFVSVKDILVPSDEGEKSKVFITTSYDATIHFQTTCSDILNVYKRCTGEDIDFSKIQEDVTTVGE